MKNASVAATFVAEKQETEVRRMEWSSALALLFLLLFIGICSWGAWRESQIERLCGRYHLEKDWYK